MSKELLLATLFVFLLLFRPTILPVDILYVLTGFSACMLLREVLSRKRTPLAELARIRVKSFFWIPLAFLSLILIAFTYNLIAHGPLDQEVVVSFFMAVMRLVFTFILLPINLAWLLLYSRAKKLSVDDLLKAVFYAIVLQLLCVMGAYFVPVIKDFFIWLMQVNGNWSPRWTENKADVYRMFGFAKSLVDTFGFGMGILSAVPWILAYRLKDLRYLSILPVIFFAIFINARTGIIIMGVVTIIFLFLFIAKRQHFLAATGTLSKPNKYAIVTFCIALAMMVFGAVSFINKGGYFATSLWRDMGGYTRFLLSGGDVTKTRGTQASTHFSDAFWAVPKDPVQLLIGAGQSVYGPDSAQDTSSDVGYINNIWLFGLIGTAMLHILAIVLLWKYRLNEAYGKAFAISCILSILLFQIKASAFWSANLGISSILLLYFIGYYEKGLLHK